MSFSTDIEKETSHVLDTLNMGMWTILKITTNFDLDQRTKRGKSSASLECASIRYCDQSIY